MTDNTSHFISTIPEVYFDLIARVPPGTFLAVVLFGSLSRDASWYVSQVRGMQWGASLAALVLLLGAGFALGVLITPLGEVLNRGCWYHVWRTIGQENVSLLNSARGKLKIAFKIREGDPSDEHWNVVYARLHQLLKSADSGANGVLPKMAAELSLCNNSCCAFAIATLALLARIHCGRPELYLSLLIGMIISRFSAKKRTKRFIDRHFAYLAVLEEELREGGPVEPH